MEGVMGMKMEGWEDIKDVCALEIIPETGVCCGNGLNEPANRSKSPGTDTHTHPEALRW